jgi:hypothetical protein
LVDLGSGVEHAIAGMIVLGADPGRDPEVAVGAATMITVGDPGIDEVQVRIRLSGSSITAEGVSSAGSWVQELDGPMIPLTESPQEVGSGWKLWLGTKVFELRSASAG